MTAASTAGGSSGSDSATHPLRVEKRQGAPPSEVQAYVLILGAGSELRAFPATLVVSAGSLRLYLTSLDRAVAVVMRREGAEVGLATVWVEPGALATVEVELAQGAYGLWLQGTETVLGQIEAR